MEEQEGKEKEHETIVVESWLADFRFRSPCAVRAVCPMVEADPVCHVRDLRFDLRFVFENNLVELGTRMAFLESPESRAFSQR